MSDISFDEEKGRLRIDGEKWLLFKAGITGEAAQRYINILFDKEGIVFGLNNTSKLERRLTRNPNFLSDLGFQQDDVFEIKEALFSAKPLPAKVYEQLVIDDSQSTAATSTSESTQSETHEAPGVDNIVLETKESSLKSENEFDSNCVRAVDTNTDSQNKISASFIPNALIDRLADSPDGIKSAFSETSKGICLIVDISGFTRLSGKFCALGKDGIDGLQKVVNGYMGTLVSAVCDHGGDIIKFAGDALICVFRSETQKSAEESPADSGWLKTLSCAWLLKDLCTAELTVHIGISYGDICFGILGGDESRWECLISGSCLSELSQCLDDAPSKHIVLTRSCHEFVQSIISSAFHESSLFRLDCTVLESGNVLLESTSEIPPMQIVSLNEMALVPHSRDSLLEPHVQLSNFVPEPVVRALAAGSFHFLSELRLVTTLFMKWDGYSEEAHKDLLSLQKYFLASQQVLRRSGGFLRQFLVDDKGCVLIAMWGAPSATYTNNCSRALWAASELSERLRSLKMPTSCGITTGNVYCGTVGSPIRREYAAIGDVVNLAARLMCKSKGRIYTDEATFLNLTDDVKLKMKSLPEILVKGKDKPIQPFLYDVDDGAFSIEESHQATSAETPIRTACKDAFDAMLSFLTAREQSKFLTGALSSSLRSASVRFLLIEGAAGAGQSEAVVWLKRKADVSSLRVVSITLLKQHGTRDYQAVSKLFRAFIQEENFDDPQRQIFVVNQILQDLYSKDEETMEKVAYPAMRTALGITCPLTKSKTSKHNELQKINKLPARMILQILHDIFKALISEHQVVIIIQDAHFMDEQSWKVVQGFSELQAVKVGIVLTRLLPIKVKSMSTKMPIGETRPQQTVSADVISDDYDWVEPQVQLLLRNDKASQVTLTNYSFSELRTYLAHTLHTMSRLLPKEIDRFVYQLSGGNPFWVQAICSFIKDYGIDEFERTVNPDKKETSQRQTTRRRSVLDSFRSSLAPASPKKFSSIESPSSSGKMSPDKMSARTAGAAVGSVAPGIGGHKLSSLILCRLATLSTDEQSVARSAAIIGTEFTVDLLSEISSPTIQERLKLILASLVEKTWLKVAPLSDVGVSALPASANSSSRNSGWSVHGSRAAAGTVMVYSFVHSMVHATLYDLSPLSLKKSVHFTIAEFAEKKYDATDDSYYLYIGAKHFVESGNSDEKCFKFSLLSSDTTFSSAYGNITTGISYLEKALEHADGRNDALTMLAVVVKGQERVKQKYAAEAGPVIKSRWGTCCTSSSSGIIPTMTLDEGVLEKLQELHDRVIALLGDVEEEEGSVRTALVRALAGGPSGATGGDGHNGSRGAPAGERRFEAWQVPYIAQGRAKLAKIKKGTMTRGQSYFSLQHQQKQKPRLAAGGGGRAGLYSTGESEERGTTQSCVIC